MAERPQAMTVLYESAATSYFMEKPRSSVYVRWTPPPTQPISREAAAQFDRADSRLYKITEAASDYDIATAPFAIFTESVKKLEDIVGGLKRAAKRAELSQLVAFSYSVETDPERLRKFREAVGEAEYSSYILWLINAPFDALPETYKEVELELYRLARYNSDVYVVILDSSRFPNVVRDLMAALGIDALPALVVATKPLDLANPDKEGTIVIRSGAVDRMARHGKLTQFVRNIPVWARMGALKDKAKWEGEAKLILAEIWDQIRQLISINLT
ncbi:hypothetical protein Pisl_1484 [Pyrobaculum islandicum DSM 4184]|uniref:Uncharacterized protein n=2 Tax=Pyrobaculum islandicum TaxID=2277 RepID=A1RUK8_PYRIL|nr:hypothetical protein Pisl_1484 [Pyrobaculum islandicum DSM 4184]